MLSSLATRGLAKTYANPVANLQVPGNYKTSREKHTQPHSNPTETPEVRSRPRRSHRAKQSPTARSQRGFHRHQPETRRHRQPPDSNTQPQNPPRSRPTRPPGRSRPHRHPCQRRNPQRHPSPRCRSQPGRACRHPHHCTTISATRCRDAHRNLVSVNGTSPNPPAPWPVRVYMHKVHLAPQEMKPEREELL